MNDERAEDKLLLSFLFGKEQQGTENIVESESLSKELVNKLKVMSVDELIAIIIKYKDKIEEVSAKNIPQFSDIDNVDKVVLIVDSSVDEMDYRKIGYFFNKSGSDMSQRKYGENHYKLAMEMGLVTERKPLRATELYQVYLTLNQNEKESIKSKLMLRIPIIQVIIVNAAETSFDVLEYMIRIIAESTAKRRGSSIRQIIKVIQREMSEDMFAKLDNNIQWGE